MIHLEINNPCEKDWNTMKIGLHSRYCDSCEKSVVDFSEKSKEEILSFLLENYNKKVCGRIYKSQLDFEKEDFVVTIKRLNKKYKNSNLAFYLLTMGALTFSNYGCSSSGKNNPATIEHLNGREDSITTSNKITETDSESLKLKKCDSDILVDDQIILGEMIPIFDSTITNGSPYIFVDTMPEFPGGIDSLYSYLNRTVIYPEWELKNAIGGTVYVQFVVESSGEISRVEILKTVEKAKKFDDEVIRVINKMPNWVAGIKNGKKVAVQYTLPIRFEFN